MKGLGLYELACYLLPGFYACAGVGFVIVAVSDQVMIMAFIEHAKSAPSLVVSGAIVLAFLVGLVLYVSADLVMVTTLGLPMRQAAWKFVNRSKTGYWLRKRLRRLPRLKDRLFRFYSKHVRDARRRQIGNSLGRQFPEYSYDRDEARMSWWESPMVAGTEQLLNKHVSRVGKNARDIRNVLYSAAFACAGREEVMRDRIHSRVSYAVGLASIGVVWSAVYAWISTGHSTLGIIGFYAILGVVFHMFGRSVRRGAATRAASVILAEISLGALAKDGSLSPPP